MRAQQNELALSERTIQATRNAEPQAQHAQGSAGLHGRQLGGDVDALAQECDIGFGYATAEMHKFGGRINNTYTYNCAI